MSISALAGFSDHRRGSVPVAGVFIRLGEGSAECEGRDKHRGHRRHAGALQGEQRDLRGHGVCQRQDAQHLRGERKQ